MMLSVSVLQCVRRCSKIADGRWQNMDVAAVMNTAKRAPLPLVTLLVIAALLALTPYAMTFTPFQGIYIFGPYEAAYDTDPLQARRAGLIAFGLGGTVLASIETFWVLYRRPDVSSMLTCVAAWFACAVIGWKSFPYWVTGVFAAYSGRAPLADFDPKALIPMIWLGELWRFGVLLLYPTVLLVAPAAIVGSILFFHRRAYARSAVPVACASIGLVFLFCFSPGYVHWLMD
jgi:hypothetical protein